MRPAHTCFRTHALRHPPRPRSTSCHPPAAAPSRARQFLPSTPLIPPTNASLAFKFALQSTWVRPDSEADEDGCQRGEGTLSESITDSILDGRKVREMEKEEEEDEC